MGAVIVAPDFYARKPIWCSKEFWWDSLVGGLSWDASMACDMKRMMDKTDAAMMRVR